MFGTDAATPRLYLINFIIDIFFKVIDTKWVACEYRSIDTTVSIRPSLLSNIKQCFLKNLFKSNLDCCFDSSELSSNLVLKCYAIKTPILSSWKTYFETYNVFIQQQHFVKSFFQYKSLTLTQEGHQHIFHVFRIDTNQVSYPLHLYKTWRF